MAKSLNFLFCKHGDLISEPQHPCGKQCVAHAYNPSDARAGPVGQWSALDSHASQISEPRLNERDPDSKKQHRKHSREKLDIGYWHPYICAYTSMYTYMSRYTIHMNTNMHSMQCKC